MTTTDPACAVQSFYGRWARLYDLVARYTPSVTRLRRRAVAALSLAPGDTVVEMGCGTGANGPHLRKAVGPEGRVVGVDFTPGVLDRARGRGYDVVVRGDATRPPVVGPVDGVLASFVVGMFDAPATAVDGWCDLVPGGTVVLLDAAHSDRRVGEPVNAVFDVLTVVSTPPTFKLRYDEPLGRTLHRRVHDARRALRDRATAHAHEEHLLGLVRLTGGRIPSE
jgi:SAM-dependent methyltransferase